MAYFSLVVYIKKKQEFRIKQYEYSLDKTTFKVEENKYDAKILSDFGKDRYELINVISEK